MRGRRRSGEGREGGRMGKREEEEYVGKGER